MLAEDLKMALMGLAPEDKAQVIQMLVSDLTRQWPGIERTPGGSVWIARSQIPVWQIESYRRAGWSEARILEHFPTLRAADLVNVWAYVGANADDIEADLARNSLPDAQTIEYDLEYLLSLPAAEQMQRLTEAAEAAAQLYETDLARPMVERELTAFSSLDGEPFDEPG